MKKIYVNNTKRVFVFGKATLLPGSNAVDEIDGKKYPILNALIEEGDIEIAEDVAKAVKSANTQKAVDEIAKMEPKDEKVKAAAGKRKAELDKLDAQAKEAAEKQAKKEKDEDSEGDEE